VTRVPQAEAQAMDPRQRRGAIVTGVVLAAMALGIYLVVILKFFVR
jgi:hypothetical protein